MDAKPCKVMPGSLVRLHATPNNHESTWKLLHRRLSFGCLGCALKWLPVAVTDSGGAEAANALPHPSRFNDVMVVCVRKIMQVGLEAENEIRFERFSRVALLGNCFPCPVKIILRLD